MGGAVLRHAQVFGGSENKRGAVLRRAQVFEFDRGDIGKGADGGRGWEMVGTLISCIKRSLASFRSVLLGVLIETDEG